MYSFWTLKSQQTGKRVFPRKRHAWVTRKLPNWIFEHKKSTMFWNVCKKKLRFFFRLTNFSFQVYETWDIFWQFFLHTFPEDSGNYPSVIISKIYHFNSQVGSIPFYYRWSHNLGHDWLRIYVIYMNFIIYNPLIITSSALSLIAVDWLLNAGNKNIMQTIFNWIHLFIIWIHLFHQKYIWWNQSCVQ